MVLLRRTVIGYTVFDALCASIIHVIASNSGWFMSLFAPVVIVHSSYFGFGFTKLT